MRNKDLKHLSRGDLLEMLLELSRENEKLQAETGELRAKLEKRTIAMDNCGSLAEAALLLNGVFEAADAACSQYRESLMASSAEIEERFRSREEECQRRCAELEEECRSRCAEQEEETRQRCREHIARANAHARAIVDKAEAYVRETLEKIG